MSHRKDGTAMYPIRPATPETRGPLVALLLHMYLDGKTGADHQVTVPNNADALVDLATLFMAYVRETEAGHGGDFQDWLQRVALTPYPSAGEGETEA